MKDIGIAVDRRTLPKDTIPHNFEHLHSKGPASPVIDKDLRGPDLGSRILPANHATGMVSKEDHEVQALLQRMSLEEQVSLLAGADFWRTVPLPQHGIPSIKTTDGPNGARGEFFKNGTKAALFPCGVSLAATWNLQLIEQIGSHLGDETLARGANVLLGPTVCMHRSPLGGRNFESFSEDPFLTGKLAAAYIRGLQSKNVAATVKHFVGNEQETHRMTINSVIDERALREIYLRPFEIAIREANPWAIMSSYNLVNGLHSDMNHYLLTAILRDEWNYDGMVMSDWTGTNSTTESIQAGCDLEMPGPTQWRGLRALKAINQGELNKSNVSKAAFNVIKLVSRTKGLRGPSEPPEKSIDNPQTSSLIREAAVQGITLLKNDNQVLPIKKVQKIAILGPNAKRNIVGGGGSATLNPYYTVNPFDGIRESTNAELIYSQGCDSTKWLPLASEHCKTEDGMQGVTLEYYRGDKFEAQPVSIQRKESTDLFLWDSAPKSVLPAYSFRVKTTLSPKTSGNHLFSFSSVGPGKFYIGGQLFIDNWDWTEEGEAMFEASQDVHKSIFLEAGKTVDLLVESTNEIRPASKPTGSASPTHKYGGCRIGYQEESTVNLLQEAVDAARAADVAIVIVGLDSEWESEGYDRQSMDLPKNGSIDRLVEAIVEANAKTVVVNQSGTPISMPWANRVPAILQTWYQGQEAGHALADVLFGKQNPSGKLPTTFPKRLEDNPSFGSWPGENLESIYAESLWMGYRHYDAYNVVPLFPFGHGLSYTSFEYGEPIASARSLDGPSFSLTIQIPITNTGCVAGHEIIQAYVRDIESRLRRPEKELKAFDKVFLQPGESKAAELVLDKYSCGYYDENLHTWIAEAGRFDVLIGASSTDIRRSIHFDIPSTLTWTF